MTLRDLYEVSEVFLIDKQTGKEIKFEDLEERGKEHVMRICTSYDTCSIVIETYEKDG